MDTSTRPKTSSAKLAKGQTQARARTDSLQGEIIVSVKQLVPPAQQVDPIKHLVTTNQIKPDIHLRPDLVKSTEMYRINSPKRAQSAQIPKKPVLDLDDELNCTLEKLNFSEMLRIGRPERDTSLRKPLMKTLQTLRRYKLGTPPSTKAGILRETLDPVVKDPEAKAMLAGMSPRGRPVSPLLQATTSDGHLLDSLYKPAADTLLPTSKSVPLLRITTPAEEDEVEKEIVIKKSDTNLYLYHLSAQGKRSAKAKLRPRSPIQMPDGLVTDSIASSTMASEDGHQFHHTNEDTAEQVPVMYDPATVRLPRMEIVPGFGSTTPLVESRLGAYRVHSNKAVATAAALEEASLAEGSRAMSLNSRHGGDSYHADRVESFYRSAETSHRNSLEALPGDQGQLGVAFGQDHLSPGGSLSSQESSSVKSPHIATRPPAPVLTSSAQAGPKRRLHCGRCYRDAELWCQRCASAFCGVCWGQMVHHDLGQMSPARPRPATEGGRSESPSPPGSPNRSYAKSVVFQKIYGNSQSASVRGAALKNSKYDSTSAAKIPLPDYVVVQYDQYPAPPVYIDGKGHVMEDVIHRRPVTAPVQTQEELHRLQMTNHFKRRSAQEQYNEMLALKYRAATSGMANGTPAAPDFPSRGATPSLGITSGVHYEQPETQPLPHSKGKIVVRKVKKKHLLLRPVSSNLAAAPNGTVSLGYSPKPRTGTKPLSGILKDGTPDDWKSVLFAGNDGDKETGRKGSVTRPATIGVVNGAATPNVKKEKPLM